MIANHHESKSRQAVLVTGAAGFIGSTLCERLLAEGHQVRGVDCFDEFYDESTKRRNVSVALDHDAFELVEADIRDEASMAKAMDGATVVIHLAARAGVRPSIAKPLLYQDVNVRGTNVLLEAARNRGIKRFVFGSSSSVYGNNEKIPFSETDNVDFPISPYAATKKSGELLCHAYHHLHDMHVACVRLFTVYGPRQRPDLAIHKFSKLIRAGRAIPVFGDGSSERDYTFVDDIVDGIIRAADWCQGYEIFNLGNSSPISLSDLIAKLEFALGETAQIERLPEQPGDARRTYADISKAREKLGYSPQTTLSDGLAKFVAWLGS